MNRAEAAKKASELISLGATNVEFHATSDQECFVTSLPLETMLVSKSKKDAVSKGEAPKKKAAKKK